MKKEVRIANIMLSSGLGGMEDMGLQCGKALSEKYFCLNIFSSKSKIKEQFKDLRYKVFVNTLNQIDIFAAFKLAGLIMANKITHAVLHGRRAQKIALLAKIFLKNPPKLIFIDHTNFHFKDFEKMDLILAISDRRFNDLKNQEKIDSKKVKKICNFVDLGDFKDLNNPQKDDELTVGWMARFHEVKGLDMFFEAIKILQKKKLNIKYIIAGGLEKDCKDYIADVDLSRIAFLGWIKKIEDFYKQINLFASTSRDEPFGLTTLYALAYKIPTVATPTQGSLEILTKLENSSILLPEISTIAIADGIEKFYNMNKEDRGMMSKNARKIAKEFYSKERFMEMIEVILSGD